MATQEADHETFAYDGPHVGDPPVAGSLEGLKFHEKWELIGAGPSQACRRQEAPISTMPGTVPGYLHSGMMASVKMRNLEYSRTCAARNAVSLPALPHEQRRELKYLREEGSPFRVLISAKSSRQMQLDTYKMCSGAVPRPDHIGNVANGLEQLSERFSSPAPSRLSADGGSSTSSPFSRRKTSLLSKDVTPTSERAEQPRRSLAASSQSLPAAMPILEEHMDPVEADALTGDSEERKAGKKNRVKAIIERLQKTDAPVAELIEYMFEHFGTLKIAFSRLDLNGNGMLSNQEFSDGILRLKSKGGISPVQLHVLRLFKRLDYAEEGSIPLEDMIKNLENDSHPMMVRFRKYVNEALQKKAPEYAKADGKKIELYSRVLKLHGSASVTPEFFCGEMVERLKYDSWHATDLFRRLDKDDSGQLSLAEFTAFLQKNPTGRREKQPELVPLGDEQRKQKVQQLYISCAHSGKIGENPRKLKAQRTTLHCLLDRCNLGSAQQKVLNSGLHRAADGGFTRPDWLGQVDAAMKERRKDEFGFPIAKPTKLSQTGCHVLQGQTEPMQDLLSIGSGLLNFDIDMNRSRITAF